VKNKTAISTAFCLFFTAVTFFSYAQTTIYEDLFNIGNTDGGANSTAAVVSGTAPNNTSWRYQEFENSFGPSWAINNQEAVIQNTFGVNRSYGAGFLYKGGDGYYTAPGGLYEQDATFRTRFKLNPSPVEWTFNFRSPSEVPQGLTNGGAGLTGGAFVLGMTSPTLVSCFSTTQGYAVIFGDAIAGNYVKLVKINGGVTTTPCGSATQQSYTFFTWNGTNTTDCIVSDNVNLTTSWYSIKVQYNPANDEWRLFVRNDGGTKGDPQTLDASHCKGAKIDATYTNNSLSIMGLYGGVPDDNATRALRFDNVRIKLGVTLLGCPSTTGLCGAYSISCTPPTVSVSTLNNSSCSAPNGSVNLTTNGTSYLWSNGAVTEDITALNGGTYTVTVTAANGCTATAAATVNNVPANPSASAVANDNTNCIAPFNGSVNLTTTATSYLWSNGAITEDLSALNTGTYTVTVTAANGCTATASATVNSTNSLGSFATSSLPNTVCNGSAIPCTYSGPAVVINEIMFMPGSNYSISGGDNTNASLQSMYNTTNSGEEWIELYNPNPCQALDLSCYIIGSSTGGSNFGAFSFPTGTSIPPLGFLVIGGTNASNVDINLNNFVGTSNLAGSSRWHLENGCGYILLTNPSGGVEDAIYWSQNNAADLTAATTCGGSFNRILTIPAICSPLVNPLPEARNIPGIEYAGNFGATAQGGSVIGKSIIRTTDGGATFLISNTGGSPGSCNGVCTPPFSGGSSCDGEASINFSSASGLTYAWNDPLAQTTDTAKGLCPGLYTVTVTNSSGCSVTTSIAVDDSSSLITITSTNSDNSRCIAPFNGSIDLNTSGTSYIWSNGAITEDLSAVNAGTYTVTVTGTGGCTATASATVNDATVNPSASAVASSNTSCIVPFNGSVNLTTSGTSYIWSNTAVTEDLSALNAGTYTVTVTGNGGCTANASATVNDATVNPSASAVATSNTSCIVPFNGSVDLTTSGTSYIWSNTAVTEDLSALNAGTYSVTVTAANGCTATTSATVIDNTSIATSSDTRINCNSFTWIDGNTYFTSNNSATYTYTGGAVNGCDSIVTLDLIINYSDSTFENNSSCNPNDTGVFVFNLTNQYSCDSVHIITVLLLPADATFENRTTCDRIAVGVVTLNLINQFGCDSVHTITTTLAPGDATFENRTTCDQNAVGVVTLNLLNQAGCDSVHTITTTLAPGDATFENRITCDSNAVGTFTFNLTNRLGCDSVHTVTYILSPAQSRNVFVNLCRGDAVFAGGGLQTTDGTYVDNLFTTQGCDSTVTTYVTVSELPIVSIDVPQDTIIRGESIVLSAVSNVAVSTYLWNPPTALSCDQCQNPTASPNSNIIYILNITDVNGCSANAFTRITVLSDSCDKNIFIPSAFTPNGDGNNDVFQIYGNCIASMKISIFNRWGEKVFESNEINQAWDGFYNGAIQTGVYTYTLNVEFKDGRKDNSNERRGSITLIR
jgi:gliding motility-associated-like protein